MIIPGDIKYLSGFIYQNNTSVSVLNVLRILLNFSTEHYSKFDWNKGTFESEKNLLGEEEFQNRYRYSIFFRESKKNNIVIVLAPNKEITNYVNQNVFNQSKEFIVIGVETQKVIDKILIEKSEYIVTSIHAKIAGMRQTVNSISLYGMDVVRSPIYKQYVDNIEVTTCGLGIEDQSYSGYSELLKVSNEGNISMLCKDKDVFNRIDKILNFLYDCFKFY